MGASLAVLCLPTSFLRGFFVFFFEISRDQLLLPTATSTINFSMGLLDQLWDDTLAGPRPETGLSRLRKYSSLSVRTPAAGKDEAAAAATEPRGTGSGRMSLGEEEAPEEEPRVTRSIMIKRPPGWSSPPNGSPLSSPSSYTPPISPFAGPSSLGWEWSRMRRKSSSGAYERREDAVASYDWSSSYPPFEV